jgi:hypothetical protein
VLNSAFNCKKIGKSLFFLSIFLFFLASNIKYLEEKIGRMLLVVFFEKFNVTRYLSGVLRYIII